MKTSKGKTRIEKRVASKRIFAGNSMHVSFVLLGIDCMVHEFDCESLFSLEWDFPKLTFMYILSVFDFLDSHEVVGSLFCLSFACR